MAGTPHFEHTLHAQRSTVTDELFQRVAGLIFEKERKKTKLEVRCWTDSDLSHYRRNEETSQSSTSVINGTNTEQGIPNQGCICARRGIKELAIVDLDLARLRQFIQETRTKFRVFYIRQRNSHSRLQILKQTYEALLDECQIFDRVSEFIIDFRWKTRECEIGPPPIKFRLLNEHGYECAYIIRYIEFTNRPEKSPWSLRQFAVYHKFIHSESTRCSTWLLIGASQRTESSFNEYVEHVSDVNRAHPFELHVIFLNTAISSWRAYLIYLLEQVAQVSERSVNMMIGKEDHPEAFVAVDVQDYQDLKGIEDRAGDIVLCLASTNDTLNAFVNTYKRLQCSSSEAAPLTPSSARSNKTDVILDTLTGMQREALYFQKQVEALLTKARNTRALISSLLERQTGHNLDRQMSALNSLEQEAKDENQIMQKLAVKSSQDSDSIRILTIITLIYLPCTVVSSFYSTQFVDQEDTPSGPVMGYAQNAWLFFAVSVPLTMFTIMVWYTWSHFRKILQMCSRGADNHEKGLRERVKILDLLRRRRELPR